MNDGHILGTTNGYLYYHFTEYSNKYYWGRNNGEANGGSWSSAVHTLEYNKGSSYSVILDGSTLGSGYQIYSANDLWIGRRDNATNFQGYVYYCRLTDKASGEIVRDLIPVRVGNVGYMYDKVSKELFANAGSGSFTLGGDIVPIEYIESTGTQWIDTGVVLDPALYEYEAKFSVAKATSSGIGSFSIAYTNWSSSYQLA